MIYIQRPEIDALVQLRQKAMGTTDPEASDAADIAHHNNAFFIALELQRPSNLWRLVEVLEQLTSEIAGARDAVEAERALRRML